MPTFLQAKLIVGASGDSFEQEADTTAARVATGGDASDVRPAPNVVQRTSTEAGSGAVTPSRSVEQGIQSGISGADGESSPIPDAPRSFFEGRFGRSFDDVRVHHGPRASSLSSGLGAHAFTVGRDIFFGAGEYAPERSDGRTLMAHELTHVVQQDGGATPLVQRDALSSPPADGGTAVAEGDAEREESFSFSEGEMEGRLEQAPKEGADASAPKSEVKPETQSKLGEVKDENAKEKKPGEKEDEKEGDKKSKGEGKGGPEKIAGRGKAPAEPGLDEAPTAEAELEGMFDQGVEEYLDGASDGAHLTVLGDTQATLVSQAGVLAEKPISEPEEEGSLLGNLTGVGPLADAITKSPKGYEKEEPWLKTVAKVRDITSALGGVVGMIGLAATVSGLILSLLMPPVGALLLTVGTFCDEAALILDIVGLALGVFLTSYNMYRLKNATDPKEKQRLLAMVRSDAMNTVFSALAVATAVAPGASKALARTKAGRAIGKKIGKAAQIVGESGVGKAVKRGAQKVGETAGKVGTFVAKPFKPIVSLKNKIAAAAKKRLVSMRGSSFVKKANQFGERIEKRLLSGKSTSSRFRAKYQRNRNMANMVNDPIERSFHLQQGEKLTARRAELEVLERQRIKQLQGSQIGPLAKEQSKVDIKRINKQLEEEFGATARPTKESSIGDFSVVDRSEELAKREAKEQADLVKSEAARKQKLAAEQQAREAAKQAKANAATAKPPKKPPAKPKPLTPKQAQKQADKAAAQAKRDAAVKAREDKAVKAAQDKSKGITEKYEAEEVTKFERFDDDVRERMRQEEFAEIERLRKKHPNLNDEQLADVVNESPFIKGTWTEDELKALKNTPAPQQVPGMPPVPRAVDKTPHHTIAAHQAPQIHRDPRFIQLVNAPEVPNYKAFYDAAYDPAKFPRVDAKTLGLSDKELLERLAAHGNTGVITHPVTNTPVLVSAHQTVGHLGNTKGTARTVLDEFGRQGLPGEAARRVVRPTARAIGRAGTAPPPEKEMPATGNSRNFAASLTQRMNVPSAGTSRSSSMPALATSSTTAGGGSPDLAIPPETAEYAPADVKQLRAWKVEIAESISTVKAYIAATHDAQRSNEAQSAAATTLKARNEEQQGFVEGEKEDIGGQQGKLDEAGTAQEKMVEEGEKASGETEKGQDKAKSMEGEAANLKVEAKPEEKKKKSWLSRAWDATAGAVWRRLVKPVIAAAKRKVDQIMKGISNFIMKLINSALGLDEIEAEIAAGGTDIGDRKEQLNETTGGLDETHAQAEETAEKNDENIEQADANVQDAQATREELQQLLASMLDQQAALEAEEAIATEYIAQFSSRYAPFFAAQREEAMASPAPAENANTITLLEVTPVTFQIELLLEEEHGVRGEVEQVAMESAGAIAPQYLVDERAVTGEALGAFRAAQGSREMQLMNLAGRARNCIGQPSDIGSVELGLIIDSVDRLARELSDERMVFLGGVAQMHRQVDANMTLVLSGGPDDEAPTA